MTAIIRIKRNCTEDPLDAVLINCKRRKIDDNASETDEDVARVLSFAGTVTDRDEDFVKHIPVLTKTEAEEQYKKHKVDVTEKLRLENLIRSKNSRYTVVNSCRFSKGNAEEAVDLNCTIVDVEAAERDSGIESASGNYVYDLYYTNSDDFGETDINELIRMRSWIAKVGIIIFRFELLHISKNSKPCPVVNITFC
ncbi:hypothetical protein FQR65_LT10594 [Abscondita terminalis]|nr:hypothetical protein FQR65_LT10594 [Abscondita terminalis]